MFNFFTIPILSANILVIGLGNPFDDFETYSDGVAVNALANGGYWLGGWVDRANPFNTTDINDNMESYSDGASVNTLSGGTSWSSNWVDR
jgi:hypothetical protein